MKSLNCRILTSVFAITWLSNCGTTAGKSLNAPKLQPPVKESTPDSLTSESLALADMPTKIEAIRSSFFTTGPTDFTYRLGMIDEEMASLDTRSQESGAPCMDESAQVWNPVGLPKDFPMSFNCVEDRGFLKVYFGINDGNFYLAELQQAGGEGPEMAVLAKVDSAGDAVEVYQISLDSDTAVEGSATGTNDWFHIIADRTTKILEVSFASNGPSGSAGCGVRMKTNGTLIYADGYFGSHTLPVNDCTNEDGAFPRGPICAQVSDLAETDLADCEAVEGLTTFEVADMNFSNRNQVAFDAAKVIINTPEIPAISEFGPAD